MPSDGDRSPIALRIEERLKALKLSASAASAKAGLSRFAIRNIQRDPDSVPRGSTLLALAAALETTPEYLLTGTITDEPNQSDGIRYGGIVEAGAFRLNDSTNQDAEYRTVPLAPDPRYPAASQFAFEVQGDSMDKARMFPGMWVQGVEVHAWERVHGEPRDGSFVIVARTRNGDSERELTVKRLRIFRDRVELVPESNNPAHKPVAFPLVRTEETAMEARIIAVVISSHWIYT